MQSFVLDIIVIELCSAGGCPLKEVSEHCFSVIKVLFLVLFWYYFVIVILYHIVSISIFSLFISILILFYNWNLQVVSEHLPR
jgi:hypothetical protein